MDTLDGCVVRLATAALLCLPGHAFDFASQLGCGAELYSAELAATGIPLPSIEKGSTWTSENVRVSVVDARRKVGRKYVDAYAEMIPTIQHQGQSNAAAAFGIVFYVPTVLGMNLSDTPNPSGFFGDTPTHWYLASSGYVDPFGSSLATGVQLQDVKDGWANSHALCGFLGHALLHEYLHAKLTNDTKHLSLYGKNRPDSECSHMAISSTAASQSCEKAGGLQACIDVLEALKQNPGDPDPSIDEVVPHDCPDAPLERDPETGEVTESYSDYVQRLNGLLDGLCGAIATEQDNWNHERETARCCFCPSGAPGCGDGHTSWYNPCPSPEDDPGTPQDESNDGITPPDISAAACAKPQDDPDSPPGAGEEVDVIPECPACS